MAAVENAHECLCNCATRLGSSDQIYAVRSTAVATAS